GGGLAVIGASIHPGPWTLNRGPRSKRLSGPYGRAGSPSASRRSATVAGSIGTRYDGPDSRSQVTIARGPPGWSSARRLSTDQTWPQVVSGGPARSIASTCQINV